MANKELEFEQGPWLKENESGARSGYDKNGQYWVDLTGVSEMTDKLLKPTRVIQVRVGSVMYRFCRGANNPTPDHVIEMSGFYHNLKDGRLSTKMEDVV